MVESETKQLFGRRQIFTDEAVITAENVVDVLSKALYVHSLNQGELQYLWDYYKGKTPILQKTKEIRETINHKIYCQNSWRWTFLLAPSDEGVGTAQP